MRIPLISFVLVLSAALAVGQDPAAMAARQANEEAMRNAQQASQNAQQAMQNAQAAALQSGQVAFVPRPKFSVRPGIYNAPLTVKIKSPRDTTTYYTTDGWTPTRNSTRYTGSITVNSTTTIQAIAVSENLWRSVPASATYTVNQTTTASSPPAQELTSVASAPAVPLRGNRMLPQGTPVRLVFASDLSSKKADVGDKIPLTLADDLKVGDVVLVKKGAPAVATVTDADGTHILGVPGEIAFEAESLNVDGVLVKLRGGAARLGRDRQGGAAVSALFVPVAGLFLVHGHDAEIQRGASFVATVNEDTPLPPAK